MEQTKSFSLTSSTTLWFTGLTGSGKSTLAERVKAELGVLLHDKNKVFILDGNMIRQGVNSDLDFSEGAR